MTASLVMGLKSLKVNMMLSGAMFSVTTGNGNARGSKYLFVATAPNRHDAAVFSKSVSIPTRYALCRIMGSIADGKVLPEVISVGSKMYIRDHGDISGSVIQTRPVTGIWMIPLQAHSDMIVRKAESSFAATIDTVIKKEFANDRYDCIAEMIGRFGNPAGKSAALSALVRASISDLAGNKLGAAMETLQLYWHSFWEAQFPELAGDPGTILNESRWNAFDQDRDTAYEELMRPKGVSSLEHLLSLQG